MKRRYGRNPTKWSQGNLMFALLVATTIVLLFDFGFFGKESYIGQAIEWVMK